MHMHASERLLRTRPTFSETVMVSVGVSKLGCTELFFVEPGVKLNLFITATIDSAPAHRARETIELLHRETRRTLFHRNSGHRTVQILT